jgi:hypothetical protein
MYKEMPYHYWNVHKEAVNQVWDSSSDSFRDCVAADVSNKGYDFNKFVENVTKLANHKFNNPYYHLNDKYTFKYDN